MNFYVFLSFVALLLYIQAGLYVFFTLPASREKSLFIGFCVALALYTQFFAFSQVVSSTQNLHWYYKVSTIGWLAFPVFFSLLFFIMSGARNIFIRRIINFVIIPGSIIIFTFYWYYSSFIQTVFLKNSFWFISVVIDSNWMVIFAGYLTLCTIIGIIILFQWKRNYILARDLLKANILLYSMAFFIFFSIFLNLKNPFGEEIQLHSLSFLSPLPLFAGLYYCIVNLKQKPFSPEVISRLVTSRISDFVFFLDQNVRIYAANRFCLENLKYNTYELQRLRHEKLFSDPDRLKEILQQAKKHPFSGEFAMDIFTKGGTPIPVMLSFVKIEDRFNTFLGMIIIGVDYRQKIKLRREVTERMRNEKTLSSIRKELEVLVEKRTHELFEANERLRQEILERKRAEQQIKSDLSEKIELVQEIHHRVKNNIQIIISLIGMLANHKAMNPEGSQALREIAERVRNISSVHEDFYASPNLSHINFSSFLKNSTEEIYRSTYAKRNIIFRLNVGDEYLGIDHAIPAGIIYYELLGNALKHAFPLGDKGSSLAPFFTVNVEFYHHENEYTLIVSDNGIGLPDDLNIQNARSTGFQLIKVLVKQHLKGKIVMQSSLGALIILKFST